MKTTAIFILIILNFISVFSQENKISRYKSIYQTLDSRLDYTLILSDNEFFIYGGGIYQWDMVYSIKAFYGTYMEHNDTLTLNYLPLDSIIINTDNGFYNKLAFYQDTVWTENQKGYTRNLGFCIKKNNKIICPHSERGILTSKNLNFTKIEKPISYSFSINGLLPVDFSQYVQTSEFSFKSTSTDIYIAHYPVSISSIDIKQISNSTLDSFSVALTNYLDTSFIYIYSDNQYERFAPFKTITDSLTLDGINKIKIQYIDKNKDDWKYLNKNFPPHWPAPQKVKGVCLTLDEYGSVVDFDRQIKKLREKIRRKYSDISYIEAYQVLLKSNYFDNKRIGYSQNDSLPSRSIDIFKMLNVFTIDNLLEIYDSYYKTPDSILNYSKIQKRAIKDKSSVQYFISKAGFTKDKTVCFLQIKPQGVSDFENDILVFERRLNQYILTGKITKGIYHDELSGNECDYYTDMRNYRLFY